MKLFVGSLVVSILLVMLAFFGLLGANPGVAIASYCTFSVVAFPLLWVATYRFFSSSVELKIRRG